jgi:hypothetical protein
MGADALQKGTAAVPCAMKAVRVADTEAQFAKFIWCEAVVARAHQRWFRLPSVTTSSTQKHKGELKLLEGTFCSCATSLQLNAAAAACAAAVSPEAADLCSIAAALACW